MIIIVNKNLYINYYDNSYSSCKDMYFKKKPKLIKIYTFYLIVLIIFTSNQFNIISNVWNRNCIKDIGCSRDKSGSPYFYIVYLPRCIN